MPRCYEGAFVLVAKKAGVVVGTGTLRPVGPGQAEVVRMSVSSSSRCAGTGSLILLQLLQRAREQSMQEVRLETTSSWLSAVSFYTCLGFVKTHEQGDDSYFVYKPGEA